MENALVLVDQPEPPAELAATLELAADFARASKAKATLAAYGSDWRVFECWCQERGLGALAASPEVVCGFLADEATCGRSQHSWKAPGGHPLLPPGRGARSPHGR